MKTKEELESLKKEMAQLKSKLVELTDEELAMVTGGLDKKHIICPIENATEEGGGPWKHYNTTMC